MMKESKRNKLKTILQIIMYVLIIISFLRSFLARAKAEEVSSIEEWFSSYSSSSFDSQWQSDLSTCPYYVLWDNSILIMAKLDYFGFACYSNSSLRDYPCSIARDVLCNPWQAQFPFIVWFRESSGLGFRRFEVTNFSAGSNINNLRYSWTGVYTFSSSDFGSFSAIPISYPSSDSSFFGTSENFYLIDAGNRGSDAYARSYTKIDVLPFNPIVDDSRFHARTFYNGFNQNVLEVSWDSSVYPSSGNMNYVKSILDLTIDINGTSSKVSFDSEEYPDLFPTSDSSYIPYYFLDEVGNIIEFTDLDSVFLTKIELTQYAYPSGSPLSSASAYYAQTAYSLSLTDTVQLPIWDNPTIPHTGGHIIDIATGSVYDNTSFTPPDGYSQQHLGDLEHVPWADVKVVSAVSLSSNTEDILDDLYKSFSNIILQNWTYFYDKSFTDFNDVAGYIQADNQYTDTYDIIIFLWNDTGSDLCWVTYTHRYYIRLMYKQFSNFQSIMEGGFAYVSDIYEYMYDRFEPLNSNLLTYFDASLSNNSILLRYVRSINGYADSINTGIGRIVGSDGRSLSDIYNLIDGLSFNNEFDFTTFFDEFNNKMTYLFVPSYTGFEDNAQEAIEDMGSLAMPFYTVKYFIESAQDAEYKSTLDVTFPSFEFDGQQYWEDYELSFNPSILFPDDWFEFLQYCNLLFFSLAIVLLTYKHIFGDSTDVRSNTI